MSEREVEATREAKIRWVMEQYGVSRDAASLLVTVESGEALVNDRVSLGPDERLDPDIEEELARRHRERLSRPTA